MLTFEYGDAGAWCCKTGCGTKWDGIVDYQRTQIREPRSAEKLGLTGDGR